MTPRPLLADLRKRDGVYSDIIAPSIASPQVGGASKRDIGISGMSEYEVSSLFSGWQRLLAGSAGRGSPIRQPGRGAGEDAWRRVRREDGENPDLTKQARRPPREAYALEASREGRWHPDTIVGTVPRRRRRESRVPEIMIVQEIQLSFSPSFGLLTVIDGYLLLKVLASFGFVL